MDLLVCGYLKQEFLESHEYQYPESLTVVFIQFLGYILFGFDLIDEEYKGFISDDRQILKIGTCRGIITVGCSYPFERGVYAVVVSNGCENSFDQIKVHFQDDCVDECPLYCRYCDYRYTTGSYRTADLHPNH